MSIRRNIIATFIASALITLAVGETIFIKSASSQATDITPKVIGDIQSHFAPMAYFEARCASCHGQHGSFYGEKFARELSDEKLREVVHEMTEGPGGEVLEGEQLQSLVAYHRSLIDRNPFISLTYFQGEEDGASLLRGEVTPESQVQVIVNDKAIDARVDGFSWSAKTPEKSGRNDVRIVARKGDAQTTLYLRDSLHSHNSARATTRQAAH